MFGKNNLEEVKSVDRNISQASQTAYLASTNCVGRDVGRLVGRFLSKPSRFKRRSGPQFAYTTEMPVELRSHPFPIGRKVINVVSKDGFLNAVVPIEGLIVFR